MRTCPSCHAVYSGAPERCPLDGALLESAPDGLVGREIGGWSLSEVIAEGKLASVYRAERGAEAGALKLYQRNAPIALERALREGRAQAGVHHPRIAALLDQGLTEEGQVFLVTELVAGRTLRQVLEGQGAQGLPWPRAVIIAMQVAEGLDAVHAAGLVHRDLKPENLMLEGGPNEARLSVKVLDLGHALTVDFGRLTQSGMVWGSAPYMSPEQVAGTAVDGRSDLYALGVILYEMLAGRRPFEAKAAVDLMQMHRSAMPASPRGQQELPEALCEMCLWLLSKYPRQRPLSARITRAALGGILERSPPEAVVELRA